MDTLILAGQLTSFLDGKRQDALKSYIRNYDSNSLEVVNAVIHSCAHFFCDEKGAILTTVAKVIGDTLTPDADVKEKLKVGHKFINFLHVMDYIEMAFAPSNDDDGEAYVIYTINQDFGEFCEQYVRDERRQTIAVKPQDWHKPFNKGVPIVKRLKSEDAEHYTIDKMPEVYKALNALQDTQWVINTKILELAETGLPALTPTVTDDYPGKFAKGRAGTVKKFSKWMDYKRCVEIAGEYVYETLYFQHNLDSRGRVYALAKYLNPQGSDLAKALLKFKSGQPTDERWIKIHIANCFGQDKLDYAGRVQWVDDNLFGIEAVGSATTSDIGLAFITKHLLGTEDGELFVKEKKTAWQAIASCIEWVQYQETGSWNIPVGVDATNSGSQFITAIAKCEKVAPEVNLEQHSNGAVGDLYQVVGNQMVVNGLDPETFPVISQLEYGDKTLRKMAKRPTMTFYYSCGPKRMATQLVKDNEKEKWVDSDNSELFKTGYKLFNAVRTVSPRGTAIMDAMKKSFNGYDKKLATWTTPVGFRATQYRAVTIEDHYEMNFDKPVYADHKMKNGKYRVRVKIRIETDKVDLDGHKLGVCANTVHSLDAAMLIKTICSMVDDGVEQVWAVHDQFGAASGNIDILNVNARKCFYNIVKDDPIAPMMTEATGKYDTPAKGTFDVSKVLTSPYFLC